MAAGAGAVKFQTYRADSLYVSNAGESDYLAQAGSGEPITEIIKNLEMPYEMIPELAQYCKTCGIEFMATPFSVADAQALDPYLDRYKIASYEISHIRLWEYIAGFLNILFNEFGLRIQETFCGHKSLVKVAGRHKFHRARILGHISGSPAEI
ncbi:N-acetylneuraminate synthase family protein [Planctomycetota bacterium]